MKTKLTIGIGFLIAFCAATIVYTAQPTTVDVKIGWTYAPLSGLSGYVFNVYSSPTAAPSGVLVTNVTGVTNVTLTLARPSDQYLYVTATDPSSNPTNYVADSDPSNIIRVRVLQGGNVKVIP